MPYACPPRTCPGEPTCVVLPAGTSLFRVHSSSRSPLKPKDLPSDRVWGGGRFDSTDEDPYPFLYAGLSETAALAEVLLRDLDFDPEGGPRRLPLVKLTGKSFSQLALARDLKLLSLVTTPDLAAVGQDGWLVDAEARDYAFTRAWAVWLRKQAAWAQGLLWLSKRDRGQRALVLFGDRVDEDALYEPGTPTLELDGPAGLRWLDRVLAPYAVEVPRPPAGSR
ncbi:RES family NAD+ phosphorylase [Streptomyces sparsogenes]|uniref:RES family NAD+ phosphorylase n=1 Tax=Streptomyces sparsogenes TaxID=67365 RepID=UPI0033206FF0